MTVLLTTDILQEASQQQQLWSDAATAAKHSIVRWRTVALGLVLASAVFATLATQLGDVLTGLGRLLSVCSGIAIGSAPVIRAFKFSRERMANWTRLRSVAEGIKSEMYRYLAHVRPYADRDADQRLEAAITEIADGAKDLQSHLLEVKPVDQALPSISDVPSYVTHRVDEQIDKYYVPKAEEASKRLGLAEGVELVLALLAVVLGAVAAADGLKWAAAWVPVVTTAAGAIAAHMGAAHYADNLAAYSNTAAQLRRLKEQWMLNRRSPAGVVAADEALVRAAEQVISRENRGWMAKLSSD